MKTDRKAKMKINNYSKNPPPTPHLSVEHSQGGVEGVALSAPGWHDSQSNRHRSPSSHLNPALSLTDHSVT